MPIPVRFVAVLAVLALVHAPARAFEGELFPTFNQSPLVQIYGLPAVGAPRVLAPGERGMLIGYEVANTFIVETRGAETLILDGEGERLTLRLGYSPRPGFELGLELPYVAYDGGFLDSFIENWHETFGLPEGRRTRFPRDRLIFHYRRETEIVLDLATPVSGLGDVRLTGAQQLRLDPKGTDMALRVSLKLPTGEADELRGSGASDLAVWLVAGCGAGRCSGRLSWQVAGGVLWLGKGEVLPDQQNRLVAFGSTGAEWRALPSIAFKTQLNAHTPFYRDTNLTPLEDASIQLVLGGTWHFSRRAALDLGVSEDLLVHTAPDVSLLVAVRALF